MCEFKPHENLLEEYKDVGNNWRYWGDTRFKQITVYLTITGVLLAGINSYLPQIIDSCVSCISSEEKVAAASTTIPSIIIAVFGVISTFLFFILEERSTYYRRAYIHRAFELEEIASQEIVGAEKSKSEEITNELGELWQYRVTDNIFWKWESSANIFRAFFCIVILLWIAILSMTVSAMSRSSIPLYGNGITILLILFGWRWGRSLQKKAGLLNERRKGKKWAN